MCEAHVLLQLRDARGGTCHLTALAHAVRFWLQHVLPQSDTLAVRARNSVVPLLDVHNLTMRSSVALAGGSYAEAIFLRRPVLLCAQGRCGDSDMLSRGSGSLIAVLLASELQTFSGILVAIDQVLWYVDLLGSLADEQAGVGWSCLLSSCYSCQCVYVGHAGRAAGRRSCEISEVGGCLCALGDYWSCEQQLREVVCLCP